MATFRYFATEAGQTVELTKVRHDGSPYTSSKHFSGLSPSGALTVCERKVQRKNNPSNHKCGARCLNATGFLCECECGGKNHGAGNFMCEAA